MVTISFNQSRYLQNAINSVDLQPPNNCQYVIVDPGSTDGSLDIIKQNAEKFDAIVLEPDKGPADGLNKGFSRCTGDIFGYLNSDDMLTPGALTYVAEYFKKNESVDILMGAIKIVDEWGAPRWRNRIPWRVDLPSIAKGVSATFQQGTFFRRSAWEKVGGFNINNKTCWDFELLVDMLLAGFSLQTTRKTLGHFRIHGESITGTGNFSAQYKLDRQRIIDKIGCPESSRSSNFENVFAKLNVARRFFELTGL
jgi:glycosyltransferase involved in cell wall biosynthesis